MKRPEQALQIQVARYLDLALRPPTFWTALDHASGVKNGKLAGALRKARGVKAGLPDIVVIRPCAMAGAAVLIGLELKATKGTQSTTQKDIQELWNDAGGRYFICRSLEDVIMFLEAHGVHLHAKISA